MHRISSWPDIRSDNPSFLNIRYPVGYLIWLARYLDIGKSGYLAKYGLQLVLYQIESNKKFPNS